MVRLIKWLVRMEWRIAKLSLKVQWYIAKLVLKIYAVLFFIGACTLIGDCYSVTWGWFVFLAVLFLPIRFDRIKATENERRIPALRLPQP